MKIDEIMSVIKELAQAQGFWCRLYGELIELKKDERKGAIVKHELEHQGFKDKLDIVMFFEN